MSRRFAAVPIGLGLLASAAFAADEKPPVRPPAPKVQAARPAQKAAQQQKAAQKKASQEQQPQQPDGHPGEQQLDRLLKMTPEEREKALQNLPPAQRQRLVNQLNAVGKWPTVEQNRARARLERLRSLPPQRQNQVRRSLNLFQQAPEDRQRQMAQELRRMGPMPDDERRAYMNTEEFRNRYSANEQQIMSNLSEIEP